MLYEVWGLNPYSSSDNFCNALNFLNWGKWGKSYVGKYGHHPTLNFQIKVMNIIFYTRFDFDKLSNSSTITCLITTQDVSFHDIGFGQFTLPNIIPTHQIRKCLFSCFEEQYHRTLNFIVRFLKSNPWILVGESDSTNMTPKMWHTIGHLFAAFELERNDKKYTHELEDKFSSDNIMQGRTF
jgi:hypothetical protein